MKTLEITRPDDWHVHFRDGIQLKDTVPATARHFGRALIMPNLKPALTTTAMINDYRERIISHLKPNASFVPYMTLYLNESVTPEEIVLLKNTPYILGAKLYPAGATTNSQEGTRSINALYPLLEVMQSQDLVLQIHGEVPQGDVFKREQNFIEQYLTGIIKNFPKLRIVLEHISSQAAVDFVVNAPRTLSATITAHHLIYNRNHLFEGGIRPHYFCLPILKKAHDQKAIQQAAISGNPKFFAGTDSAPHPQSSKESTCGCAGIFSAPYALSIYTECFENLNHLERLNDFMGKFGAEFYRLPMNQDTVELIKKPKIIPEQLSLGNDFVVPIEAGMSLAWSVNENE